MDQQQLLLQYSSILDRYYEVIFRPKTTKEEIAQFVKDREALVREIDKIYHPPNRVIDGNVVEVPAPPYIMEKMCGVYEKLIS